MTPETTTPDLVTHLDPRNVGMTIQLGKQAADEINQLHRERVATMAAEIQAMREAIKEARDVFVDLSEYWNKDQNENAMADACWHTVETSYDALAKLEPFIPDATPTKP